MFFHATNTLQEENEALKAEIKRLNAIINPPVLNEQSFERKKNAVLKHCSYGETHFCDGTVNRSTAGKRMHPLPPCPKYKYCELRRMKLTYD